MNGLLGMGLGGWLLSLAAGLGFGLIFFWTIRAQVDYVVRERGPTWLLPATLYARLGFVAVVLVLIALLVPREKLAGALLAGTAGVVCARALVSRGVRRPRRDAGNPPAGEEEP